MYMDIVFFMFGRLLLEDSVVHAAEFFEYALTIQWVLESSLRGAILPMLLNLYWLSNDVEGRFGRFASGKSFFVLDFFSSPGVV